MIDPLTQVLAVIVPLTGDSDMTAILNMPKIDTKVISIKDVQVIQNDDKAKRHVPTIMIDGEQLSTQQRFWTSLFSRYGFNSQFFKYFDHAEVFQRIHDKEKNDNIRICIERYDNGPGRMLAVSNPSKPIADIGEVLDLLQSYDGERFAYHDGELSALHSPRISGSRVIGGDLLHNKFSVHVPIDGYGQTNLYLAMLRMVCKNGLVAVSKAFRSTLHLGKKDDSILPTLARALDSYNNDEGFSALHNRIESAASSWASVGEATKLYEQLIKMHIADEIATDAPMNEDSIVRALMSDNAREGSRYASERVNEFTPVLSAFHKLTGDTSRLYGIANAADLSQKRREQLPMKCTMYDLINFATEVSTHHSTPAGQRRLQGWFGTQVSMEYDLEGTQKEFPEFADFHMDRRLSSGTTGSQVGDNAHLNN